jgi:hypothetical protein
MRIALLTAVVALSGCVDPSRSIATELGRYGLEAGQAQCVGQRLEDNLTLGQLQQLARAAGAYTRNDTTPGTLTASDLLRVAGQIRDPKVPLEVVRAANGCGVAPLGLLPS